MKFLALVNLPVTATMSRRSKASRPRPDDEDDKGAGDSNTAGDDEKVWVQCNACNKWRSLPSIVDVGELPEIWNCALNTYDSERNSCDAPEEVYSKDYKLKSYMKLWLKKFKCAEKAESRLPVSAVTRGRKRRAECDWIQCSNPSCGKWRSVLRGMDVPAMLKRLNKGNQWNVNIKSSSSSSSIGKNYRYIFLIIISRKVSPYE